VTEGNILVYGYGNPGRQDDGLGPFLVERLETLHMADIECDSNYQLNIEDACDLARSRAAVFIDASVDGPEPFSFERIVPSEEIRFTTHSISPNSVLALCLEIYGKEIPAYMLAVRGYSWNFGEPMTAGAEANMGKALVFLKDWLEKESPSAD
jgi:hydrogenase maturation protease